MIEKVVVHFHNCNSEKLKMIIEIRLVSHLALGQENDAKLSESSSDIIVVEFEFTDMLQNFKLMFLVDSTVLKINMRISYRFLH